MRWSAVVLLAALTLGPAAEALPMPAGTCSALDDGVASLPLKAPRPVVMRLPTDRPQTFRAPFQTAVVDLSLRVGPDGGVSNVRLLCASPANPAFTAALLQSAAQWRFEPSSAGQVAAYRIIVPGPASELRTIQRVFLGAEPL